MLGRILAATALVCALACGHAGAAEPDRDTLLLYNLLDLDQGELFKGRDETPMAELKAWNGLYDALRDRARTDRSDDARDLKAFLLMGWIARVKAKFGTIEAFNTDLMVLIESRESEVLRALADEDFMVADICTYLAKFFFFENADPAKREAWMKERRARFEAALGPQRAASCFDAFWRVTK